MNKCYLFNDNGEFICEHKLQIDPLETKLQGKNVYVGLPQNATIIKPMKVLKDEVAVFNGNEWIKIKREILKKNEDIKEKTLDELKELKIKEIKDKTAEVILSRYSTNTQSNIKELRINTTTKNKYTQDDKDEMLDWIDDIRLQGIIFQEEVIYLKTIKSLNNYKYEFKIEE